MGATEARRTYSNQLPSSKFCSQHLLKGATATNRNENDLLQHDHRGAKGHIKTHSQLQLSISQTWHHIASYPKSGPGGELTKDAEHRKRRKTYLLFAPLKLAAVALTQSVRLNICKSK